LQEADAFRLPSLMTMRIVVIGAGGHAHVVIDTLKMVADHDVAGIVSPHGALTDVLGVPWIGGDDVISGLLALGIQGFIVAVGDNVIRRRLFADALSHGLKPVQAIHPSAVVARDVYVGRGVVMMANVVVNAASRIEDNVIINTGATVDHHAWIGSDVHIAPGCHLAGRVRVGAASFLGTGVSVIPEVTIGERAVVGAGATIYKDVPDDSRVVGPSMRFIERRGTL
jgi:UDP-perosamine 4-acetyltransferase